MTRPRARNGRASGQALVWALAVVCGLGAGVGLVAALGLFIIPAKKRTAKKEMGEKVAHLRELLMEALDSDEVILQQAAIAALGEIKATEAVDKILTFASSEDWLIRQRIAEALGNLETEKSISALRFLAKDMHSQVKEAALISLQRLGKS